MIMYDIPSANFTFIFHSFEFIDCLTCAQWKNVNENQIVIKKRRRKEMEYGLV